MPKPLDTKPIDQKTEHVKLLTHKGLYSLYLIVVDIHGVRYFLYIYVAKIIQW